MMKKLFAMAMAMMLFAAVMPVRVAAEETGEEAETFEENLIVDEYTAMIVCHANGGRFDPNKLTGVSDDKTERQIEADVLIWEDDSDEDSVIYTVDIDDMSEGLSRKGYKFDGWYMDKGLTEKLKPKSSTQYPEDFDIYAKWKAVKGWEKTKEGWIYHVSENDYYTDGIYEIGGKKYCFDINGIMKTGWQKVSGKWYYFKSSGVMATGWQKISGKWYYLGTDGKMVKGWQKISGKWYYFKSSGIMVTGWLKLSGKWYYLTSSGVMKTGWLKLSGKWYYFLSSGVMVTGTKKIGSKTYNFSSSGVCLNP